MTLLSPGQGSQRAGMASSFPTMDALLREIVDATGVELGAEPAVGRESSTLELQLWLLASTVAGASSLVAGGHAIDAVAGHSVGEYGALVCAGVLDFAEAAWIVARRAEAMSDASRHRAGSMAAVIGLAPATVERLCDRTAGAPARAWIANANSPSQVVISGDLAAVDTVGEACRVAGAVRVLPLRVPLAGHSPLMEPAAAALADALRHVCFRPPRCPFYSGYDARPHLDAEPIRASLVEGLTRPVRFADAISRAAADGHRRFAEVGPGRVLARLARETLPPAAEVYAVQRQADLDDLASCRLELENTP